MQISKEYNKTVNNFLVWVQLDWALKIVMYIQCNCLYNVIVSFSMYSRLVNYWLTFRAWLGFMIWKFPLFRFMPIFDKLKWWPRWLLQCAGHNSSTSISCFFGAASGFPQTLFPCNSGRSWNKHLLNYNDFFWILVLKVTKSSRKLFLLHKMNKK